MMKKLIILLPLSILCSFSVLKAQVNQSVLDSLNQKLKNLPEYQHDSVYIDIGALYYQQYNQEGYRKALDYFLKLLALGEKYNNKAAIANAYFLIATVYDAEGQDGEKIIYYYKKAHEMCAYHRRITSCINLLYNVAHAYNLNHDSATSMLYLHQFDKEMEAVKFNNPQAYDNYVLLGAYLSLQNKNIPEFLKRFEKVNKNIEYKDGRFHFGRYYAICKWRYAFEKGEYKKAIESIQYELAHEPTDSSVLIDYLTAAFVKIGDYKNAYEMSELSKISNNQSLHAAVQKDLEYGLLKADNLIKEKEKKFLEIQRAGLYIGLFIVFIGLLVVAYLWQINRKAKRELLLRNREKEVLMHEIQHRVKNNLQLIYGLNILQLDKLEGDSAKVVWEKNLSTIKAMSIINDKLYQKDISKLSLREFIEELSLYSKQLFDQDNKVTLNLEIQHPLSIDANFASSFGIILTELMTNSFKHGLKGVKEGAINIESSESDNILTVHYFDSGNFIEAVKPSPNSNGISLVTDLVKQLKGKIVTQSEGKAYHYHFIFPIKNNKT
jgi:two-component sensor histidine kinase